MKRRLKNSFAVVLLIVTSHLLNAQTPHTGTDYSNGIPVNFIRTWEATAPETDPNAFMNRPLKDVKQATQYFDGLGRPLQTVVKKGSLQTDPLNPQSSATASDLVSPVEYDAFGREQFKWLSYTSTDNTGAFKMSPFAQQLAFYNDANGVLKNQGENFFYSQTNFESSPLNMVQESFSPGINWVGTSSQSLESNRHSIKEKYWLNTTTDDVKMWTVTDVQNSFGTYAISTVNNGAGPGVYPGGQLYKSVTVDEHNKQVIEFKDKEGRIVLKKVQLTSTSDDGTGKNYTGWMSTYYIHDDLGNLRCVVQPEGVKWLIQHSWNFSFPVEGLNTLSEQCFRYEYDKRSRMVIKKVPGAAPVYLIYDQRDRLVMMQDGNLTAQNKWLVTLYDDQNRPVQTGLWTNASDRQTHANAAQGSSYYYYPFNTAPADGTWEKLTSTHYDDYSGLPALLTSSLNTNWSTYFGTASNTYPYYQALTPTTITKGLTTWTETKVLGTVSQFITTVIVYDEKARPIQVKSINITGGEDVTTTQYNWVGQPMIMVQKTEKAGTNAQTTVVASQMSYDDLGRVVKVEKRQSHTQVPVNGVMNGMSDYKTLVAYEYDKLGRLKSKKLAPQFNYNTGLETITYDYNIRGWILGANRDYVKDNPSNNYFGFDLGYDKANNGIVGNQTYNNPQFNGNIEGMIWKSKGDGEKRRYDFAYDAANRFLKADFTQYTNGSFNQNAGVNFNVRMGDGVTLLQDGSLDPTTAYDDNGNIKQMQQWGLKLNSSVQIDNLRYTYIDGSNRLKSVTDLFNDATTKLGDFKTNGTHPQSSTKAALTAASTPAQFSAVTDYSYDVNGNLNLDNNKGVSSITYNHMNLPQTVTLLPPLNSTNGSRTITYTYDAAGNKLKKETYEVMGPGANKKITTTYLNGQVYETKLTNQGGSPEADDHTDLLQFIGNEEGRIRFKAAVGGITASLQYDYMLRDHLGNVRMVLTEEQKTDQYPPASMETTQATTEEQLYAGLPQTRTLISTISGYPTDNYTNPNNYVAKVKAASGSQSVGPSITLKVMAGDKFNIYVSSWYKTNGATPQQPVNVLTDLVSALTNGVSGVSTSGGHTISTTEINNNNNNILSPGANTFLGNQTYNSAVPKAYINWVLFDEQFNVVMNSSGFEQVGGNEQLTTHVKTDLPISKNGYLYVYVSNATPNIDVFFDNLQVTHTRGAILEESHYYPFGLTMAGISSRAASGIINRNKFNSGNELQSNEFNDGSGLELYDAVNRMYDPQLGRFWQIDELAESHWDMTPYNFAVDNPVSFNDPLGLKDKKPNPNAPVWTPKSNMEPVTVKGRTMSTKKMQALYWRLMQTGGKVGDIKNAYIRERFEKYDDIQKYMRKVHEGVQEDGYMLLEFASWWIPVGQITKLKYLKSAINLLKFRRGAAATNVALHTAELLTEGNRITTVLGKATYKGIQGYEKVAAEMGYNSFQVSDEVWRGMSEVERWAANESFLSDVVARGDEIVFSKRVTDISTETGFFKKN